MSEYEIEEDEPVGKQLAFFKEPIPKEVVKQSPVDESYLSAYEEMKQDERTIKDNLETMNACIKAARMPGETTLTLGKMVAFFTDIEGSPKVDWEAMAKAMIGDIEPELLAKYTTVGKPQTRVVVKRLSK